MTEKPIHIGYWVPDKKRKKMHLVKFEQLCRQRQVAITYLDLEKQLGAQGQFDVIFHKLSDEITVAAETGDPSALSRLNNFLSYVRSNPEVPIVDPLERTQRMRDRCVMFQLLRKACQSLKQSNGGVKVFVPNFAELEHSSNEETWLESLRKANVEFPCVCKPSDAGVPTTAHNMSLVFTLDGLKDVALPCVAQTFINHDGVLYKLFVFGEKNFITARPSIKNQLAGEFVTQHFTTEEVSKPDSKSHLICKANSSRENTCRVDCDIMDRIAGEVRKTLGIDLLGIDVIVDSQSGNYAIIDVNPFPGFNGIPDIHEKLLEYLIGRAIQYRSSLNTK